MTACASASRSKLLAGVDFVRAAVVPRAIQDLFVVRGVTRFSGRCAHPWCAALEWCSLSRLRWTRAAHGDATDSGALVGERRRLSEREGPCAGVRLEVDLTGRCEFDGGRGLHPRSFTEARGRPCDLEHEWRGRQAQIQIEQRLFNGTGSQAGVPRSHVRSENGRPYMYDGIPWFRRCSERQRPSGGKDVDLRAEHRCRQRCAATCRAAGGREKRRARRARGQDRARGA